MTVINETKKLGWNTLRNFCVKNHYCTGMLNDQYDRFLEKADKVNITASDLYDIALDIMEYSTCFRDVNTEEIESLMFELNELTHTFYELEH